MPEPATREGQAVEMTGRGKRGKPKAVSLSSHPPWKSPGDFHIPTASTTTSPSPDTNHRYRIVERSPYLVRVISASFRLIFQLEYAGRNVGK